MTYMLKCAVAVVECEALHSLRGALKPEIRLWCEDNLKKLWCSVHDCSTDLMVVEFEDADEALLFKLTWVG